MILCENENFLIFNLEPSFTKAAKQEPGCIRYINNMETVALTTRHEAEMEVAELKMFRSDKNGQDQE